MIMIAKNHWGTHPVRHSFRELYKMEIHKKRCKVKLEQALYQLQNNVMVH